MSLSANTHRRIVWTLRVLLAIGGSPVPAIVLGTLSGFVAYRLRPTGGVPMQLGVA